MIARSSGDMQSNKVRGALWLIAALPMIVVPAWIDGSKSLSAIGIMFLIFGLVALRQK